MGFWAGRSWFEKGSVNVVPRAFGKAVGQAAAREMAIRNLAAASNLSVEEAIEITDNAIEQYRSR